MKMIHRILIANRGEIAVRIIRACKELGIETIQVYSEADRDSLPVELASSSVCVGTSRAIESYLNANTLISAALSSKADAIHPGYGFLAENAEFAELCGKYGLCFVGPQPDVIRLMGDKIAARKLAGKLGIPLVPGSMDPVDDVREALAFAHEIGYPVLLKAAAGGGGRGMRVVYNDSELEHSFKNAQAEAIVNFGDGSLYVEKYLNKVRHVEIQVLGDGNQIVHLGERDCSIQRRHQKLIEESPSLAISSDIRKRMADAAVRLSRHVGYKSAGTVEFIFDEKTGQFYFIEMNTRIQVEHPVTEMITGMDLVKEQIRIAAGESLQISQEEIVFKGHAIECRINADDPANNYMPRPGLISRYIVPGGNGIRVDTHAYQGYSVPRYYDSLLAKVIAWGQCREESLERMRRALDEFKISGLPTNIDFHRFLLKHRRFVEGNYHTQFVEKEFLSLSEEKL